MHTQNVDNCSKYKTESFLYLRALMCAFLSNYDSQKIFYKLGPFESWDRLSLLPPPLTQTVKSVSYL